jgi:hypothetical protein
MGRQSDEGHTVGAGAVASESAGDGGLVKDEGVPGAAVCCLEMGIPLVIGGARPGPEHSESPHVDIEVGQLALAHGRLLRGVAGSGAAPRRTS